MSAVRLSALLGLFVAGSLALPAHAQWAQQRVPAATPALTDLQFLDATHGVASAAMGGALRTDDGGVTWQAMPTGVPSSLRNIFFASPDTGYIVGNIGVIIRTTDGGRTWTHHDLTNTGSSVNGVYFHSGTRGYVTQGDQIFETKDAGQTWSVVYTYNGTLPIFTFRFLQFPDSLTGYAVGGYAGSFGNVAEIAKTTDGGVTWNLIPSGAGGTAMGAAGAAAFPHPSFGYVIDVSNRLFTTTNGGQSWAMQQLSPNGNTYSMAFADSVTGWMGGDQGMLRMTTDGGQTWVDQRINGTDLYATISAPVAGVAYAGGAFNNSADAGVVKYTAPQPSGLPKGATAALGLWPNPARAAVQLAALPANQAARLTVIDAQGRTVRTLTLAAGSRTLSTADLVPGLYTLRAQAGSQAFAQRLVVE